MSKPSPDLVSAADKVVAAWPPLSDKQLDRIAALLRPTRVAAPSSKNKTRRRAS